MICAISTMTIVRGILEIGNKLWNAVKEELSPHEAQPDKYAHVKSYVLGASLIGYSWAEKLDGIYACWTGRQLLTKTGRVIEAANITRRLPVGIALEGELCLCRGIFQRLLNIFRTPQHFGMYHGTFQKLLSIFKTTKHPGWTDVHFIAFEAAAGQYGVRHVTRKPITNVTAHLKGVVDKGGEGIVLYGPCGETYKMKPRYDAEATVLGKTGKQSVRVRCNVTGVDFRLRTRHSLAKGAMVTYSYMSRFDSGKPREPILKCVRNYE